MKKINGLNIRHVSQIVRRKMITKVGKGKKDIIYSNKHKKNNNYGN